MQNPDPDEKKNDDVDDVDDATRKVTRQFIYEMNTKIFGNGDVDPVTHKLLLPGNAGPLTIRWDNVDTGKLEIVRLCNKQPKFGTLGYSPMATSLPDGYSLCLSAIKMPNGTDSDQYKEATKELTDINDKIIPMVSNFAQQYEEYVTGCGLKGVAVKYNTGWSDYIENEKPGEWNNYQLLKTQYQDALQVLHNIQLQNKDMNPVVKAINDWSKFDQKTTNGTKTPDAYWTTDNNPGLIISEWKLDPPKYSGGDSFTCSNSSGLYKHIVVDAKLSGLWGVFSIGVSNGVNKTISNSSTYTIKVEWLASLTTTFTAPSEYNIQLVKSNRNIVQSNYKGPVPTTGTPNANIQGIVTSATVMFGLTITGTFDDKTYNSIKQEATKGGGVVCFGLFGIGTHDTQKFSKTVWNDNIYSFTATCNKNEPFVVGMIVDPLN